MIFNVDSSDSYSLLVEEGKKLFSKGLYSRALPLFMKAFRVRPDSSIVLFNIGRTMEELDDPMAEDFYIAAIGRKSVDALYQIGVFYASGGRNNEAITAFKEFLRLNKPDDEWSKYAKDELAKLGSGVLEVVWRNPTPNKV